MEQGDRAGVTASMVSGGARQSSVTGSLQGISVLLDPVIRRMEFLRRCYGGSGRSGDHRGRGFVGAEVFTGGELGPKLRHCTG